MTRRRTVPWLLLSVLCLPAASSRAGPSPAEPGQPTPAAVDTAIENGVRYLLGKQHGDGTWGSSGSALGKSSLACFALLHAGLREDEVGRDAKRLRRTLRYLDTHGPGRRGRRDVDPGTYTTSLLLLLLRERARPIDRARMQRLANLLVRTQAANGQWGYSGEPGKTGKGGPRKGDNSNTQFAVLALGAAWGAGLTGGRGALVRARRWWRTAIRPDGGFGYASGGSSSSTPTGSMTAAGIACLGVLNTALDGAPIPSVPAPSAPGASPNPEPSPAVVRGLAWFAEHFTVSRNAGPIQMAVARGQAQRRGGRGWLHYYLWTLERAFVLTEVERIAARDWYREGAAQLLGTQTKDGSWRGEHPLYATSFALLFLTRAADPPRAFTRPPPAPSPGPPGPAVTGPQPAPAVSPAPGSGEPAVPPPPSGTVDDWVRESLPPGVLADRCRLRGPATLDALVSYLQVPTPAFRQRAFEALSELLPPERLFRVDRHPLARGRLRAWLRREQHRLVLAGGRFVLPSKE